MVTEPGTKLAPATVSVAPVRIGFGLTDDRLTNAATVKLAADGALVPPVLATTTGPVVVPVPTTAVSDAPVEVATLVAGTPLTVTLVTLHRLLPETVIVVVAAPVVGVNELIVGTPVAEHVGGMTVPKHDAGTVTAVVPDEVATDQDPEQAAPFNVSELCACAENGIDNKATSGAITLDMRTLKVFI